MKTSTKIGWILMGLSLVTFFWILFEGKYSPEKIDFKMVFSETNTIGLTSGEEIYELLDPEVKGSFCSKWSFYYEVNKAIDLFNEGVTSQDNSSFAVKDRKLEILGRLSYRGILSNTSYRTLLFYVIFFVSSLGAFLIFIPRFGGPLKGIRNDGIFHSSVSSRGWLGILLGFGLTTFYVLLYWFPHYLLEPMILVDTLSFQLNGGPASVWFMYGFMYTMAVIVMGVRMIMKYRHVPYHQLRTYSVIFFQLCFAFLIPEIMAGLNLPAVDLKNMWPLDYSFFFDYRLNTHLQHGTLGLFLLVWGIALFVIGVPLFTYFFGKRWYCSWVCGCGGLAETVGDPFRQLSDKSLKAWKIERYMIHGVLVFAVVMTVLVLGSYFTGNDSVLGMSSGSVRMVYGFLIGSVFSGVVGTGFYPLMGNRVWCRFGCPLAAYIGLFQRKKSKFRITTNGGQCISCGNCSTYCEMGIDVRHYAQRGQNIVRSSCVGCGICSSVCPRGVLKLENGPEEGRVSDDPIIIGHDAIKLNPEL